MDMDEETVSELENISIESLTTKKQREQRLKKKEKNRTEYPRTVEHDKRHNMHIMGILEESEKGK